MRLLVVGEAPNATEGRLERPGLALTGASGRRIASLAGMSWLGYLRRTERVNLLEEYPPAWDAKVRAVARLSAGSMMVVGRRVVLCGDQVAAAFGFSYGPRFVWLRTRGAEFGIIPHPSGRSRLWNDPKVVAHATEFLSHAFKEA